MKTFFILFIAFTAIKLSAQMSEFAPIGAKWWYDQYQFSGPQDSYWIYEAEKDTLIGVNLLRKVTRKRISTSGSEYIANPVFYYQDGNKIFIKDYYTDTLKTFFDFGASVGDTIQSFNYYTDEINGPAISIIDSIKNVSMGSAEIQAFYLHNKEYGDSYHSSFTNIFYSIGPYEYPFPNNGLADPPEGGALRCYEDADMGLLKFTDDATCEFFVSVEDHTEKKIKVYPDPVHGWLSIESNERADKILISSITGNIFSPEIHYAHNAFVNLSNLPEGIYLVIVFSNDKLIGAQKIIKQ